MTDNIINFDEIRIEKPKDIERLVVTLLPLTEEEKEKMNEFGIKEANAAIRRQKLLYKRLMMVRRNLSLYDLSLFLIKAKIVLNSREEILSALHESAGLEYNPEEKRRYNLFYQFPSRANDEFAFFYFGDSFIHFFGKRNNLEKLELRPYNIAVDMLAGINSLSEGDYEFVRNQVEPDSKLLIIGKNEKRLEDVITDVRDIAILKKIYIKQIDNYVRNPRKHGWHDRRFNCRNHLL